MSGPSAPWRDAVPVRLAAFAAVLAVAFAGGLGLGSVVGPVGGASTPSHSAR